MMSDRAAQVKSRMRVATRKRTGSPKFTKLIERKAINPIDSKNKTDAATAGPMGLGVLSVAPKPRVR